MGVSRNACRVLVGDSEEGAQYGYRGVDGRMILKRIFKKCIGRHRLDCSGSLCGHVADACECGSEPSGLIKCGKLSD